ncbi:hypothetical protein ACCO45_009288 [Purpureocillium lilacinum]|uniref:Uncharacterized protein n=1 Tax=Purpureocillium lilacinum TaxID=33203 RepID=A0ACC4DK10_PURLI
MNCGIHDILRRAAAAAGKTAGKQRIQTEPREAFMKLRSEWKTVSRRCKAMTSSTLDLSSLNTAMFGADCWAGAPGPVGASGTGARALPGLTRTSRQQHKQVPAPFWLMLARVAASGRGPLSPVWTSNDRSCAPLSVGGVCQASVVEGGCPAGGRARGPRSLPGGGGRPSLAADLAILQASDSTAKGWIRQPCGGGVLGLGVRCAPCLDPGPLCLLPGPARLV